VVREPLVPVEVEKEITTFIRLECLPDTVDPRKFQDALKTGKT